MIDELLLSIQQLTVGELRLLLTHLDTDPTITDFVDWCIKHNLVPRIQFFPIKEKL